jgi:hypothetical protein
MVKPEVNERHKDDSWMRYIKILSDIIYDIIIISYLIAFQYQVEKLVLLLKDKLRAEKAYFKPEFKAHDFEFPNWNRLEG